MREGGGGGERERERERERDICRQTNMTWRILNPRVIIILRPPTRPSRGHRQADMYPGQKHRKGSTECFLIRQNKRGCNFFKGNPLPQATDITKTNNETNHLFCSRLGSSIYLGCVHTSEQDVTPQPRHLATRLLLHPLEFKMISSALDLGHLDFPQNIKLKSGQNRNGPSLCRTQCCLIQSPSTGTDL